MAHNKKKVDIATNEMLNSTIEVLLAVFLELEECKHRQHGLLAAGGGYGGGDSSAPAYSYYSYDILLGGGSI